MTLSARDEHRAHCPHADVRYFADERRAIACMNCGRLFGHLDDQKRMIPPNPTPSTLFQEISMATRRP